MLERPTGGERAILVNVELPPPASAVDPAEFAELATSAGVLPLAAIGARRVKPDAKYFVGEGKANEIKTAVEAQQAEVVLFDRGLSPAQERNLERLIDCRVLDRTGVILDIFAQRARSFEGKLQVEMAQLTHLSTRLIRGWTHLERQRGGIGLRGPGETQLETDRRLIGKRIKQLSERLAKVRQQRAQGTRARKRAALSTVALVGYTNAGKSTLFNRLTASDAFAADLLFATLDTTLRRMNVPGEHPVLLSDTVGFIRDLPPELIAAFQATLDETKDATLLLHVVDASAQDAADRADEVRSVLARIGAESTPLIEVYNKIDKRNDGGPRMELGADGLAVRVFLSAATGDGIELLKQAIAQHLDLAKTRQWVELPPQAGRLRARLYQEGAVLAEELREDGGWALEVTVSDVRWAHLLSLTENPR